MFSLTSDDDDDDEIVCGMLVITESGGLTAVGVYCVSQHVYCYPNNSTIQPRGSLFFVGVPVCPPSLKSGCVMHCWLAMLLTQVLLSSQALTENAVANAIVSEQNN